MTKLLLLHDVRGTMDDVERDHDDYGFNDGELNCHEEDVALSGFEHQFFLQFLLATGVPLMAHPEETTKLGAQYRQVQSPHIHTL